MSDLGSDLGPDIGPDLHPAPVAAGTTALPASAILVAVVFTFLPLASAALPAESGQPDLGPDLGPDVNERPLSAASGTVPSAASDVNLSANAGQSVSVQMLDGGGTPYQDYVPGLTVDLGAGQYGATFSAPPAFTGFARARMDGGTAAGQTNSQAVNLGQAADLTDVAWTLGGPQTSVFDPGSNSLVAGSDGFLHVLVCGRSNADGAAVSPAGNPVALAVTSGAAGPGDFQAADWLTVTTGPAAGTYARLALSADRGNTLDGGNYRMTWQIDGKTTMRVPGYIAVSGSLLPGLGTAVSGSGISPGGAVTAGLSGGSV